MVPRISGPLKQPDRPGFMGPLALIKVLEAAEEYGGPGFANELRRKAHIIKIPDLDEPIRETQVARLHQVLRSSFSGHAHEILQDAGRNSADFVMNHRMPSRAQNMMRSMPWPTAAWLLGRSLLQNSWTFAGSGLLSTPNRMEFKLCNSVFTKGEASECPVCSYHAALFGRLYSSLVHSDLVCTETQCSAQTGQNCHFLIHVAKKSVD